MILGIGTDVVMISSFQEQLLDDASTFRRATFTPRELRDANSRSSQPARHLAARYAAKEALIKAWSSSRWGLPPRLSSINMLDIEVLLDAFGRPRLIFHGQLSEPLGDTRVHLSLSHDGDYALAFVTLERTVDA